MRISRAEFVRLAVASTVGFVGGCNVSAGNGERRAAPRFDDNFTIVFSDAHVCGAPNRAARFTPKRLERFVDDVLAMRPMPRRVVHLGDLALYYGSPEDYAVSVPMLKRLEQAGIELVFCMGNHDRRSAFAEAWPGVLEKSPVPGRFVSVTSLGTADLVVLDGLQGADDRPEKDMGPVGGQLNAEQIAWLERELPTRTRPFLVASHFPIKELKLSLEGKTVDLGYWLLKCAPKCIGYLYGHMHYWSPLWMRRSWSSRKTLRTLCMPSLGLWGDIGYVTLRTSADRAVCRLEMNDFFFPAEPEDPNFRPAPWKIKVEETNGQTCTFLYDREGV